ncbi:hypothetical protein [Stygiolobus caldivivus]|uniref:Uncharacterized protein n=1 Tax=Stygiolobus caldivivus TaxID=2824673 RepID=A0A8D5U6L2_9CREN|nr:hypothetical protein [Stygiolobus caldivivus]BCU69789.1 hypothetical protein KN1_10860 [Stygiolobus caldivivus]
MSEKLTKDDIIAIYTVFMSRYVKFSSIYFFLIAGSTLTDYLSISLKNLTISIIVGEAITGVIAGSYIILFLISIQFIKLNKLFLGFKNMLNYSLLKIILLVIYFLINRFLPYYSVPLFETIATPLAPVLLLLPPGSPVTNRFNRGIYLLSLTYLLISPVYYFVGVANSFLVASILLLAGGIYIAIR